MIRFRWSKLYPRAWREEFGAEFDELNDQRGVNFADGLDILFQAALVRFVDLARSWPFALAWIAVAFLNLCATEVQWAAGGLLLSAFCASIYQPKKWLHYACFFFAVIPVSTLLIYQDPTTKHAPLYQTAVAFIPAVIGALFGRMFGVASQRMQRSRS